MLRTLVRVAPIVLVTGVVAAACSPVQMGAAAIVGTRRISATNLSAQAANLKAGYQRYKDKIQLQYPASQTPQEALAWMVRFRVRDTLARRHQITVSPAQAQHALAAINAQIKRSGGNATLPELAVANGLPPDMISNLGQYQAIETELLKRLAGGTIPSSSSALRALETEFSKSECQAAKSLNIKISPQFGRLNYSDFSIVSAPNTLSAPESASPSPTPSGERLTPPC